VRVERLVFEVVGVELAEGGVESPSVMRRRGSGQPSSKRGEERANAELTSAPS
jgi:hypothetical protein